MQNAVLLLLGFVLLILQASASALANMHPFSPNLLLPVVIYLGVSHDVGLVRGGMLAFVLGYLLDSFTGSPMGLHTFVLVATYMLARGAGLSLFLRGPLFQIGLTFAVSVIAGGTILALRAIFERPAAFEAGTVWDTVYTLVAPALTTAALAPLVFLVVRRVDQLVARRTSRANTTGEGPSAP
jgi:rod shape-determining protein MreD